MLRRPCARPLPVATAPTARRSGVLLCRAPDVDREAPSGVAVGGALASSAIIAEGVQIAGTAVLLYLGQRYTGAETPVELVSMLITEIQDLGGLGYLVFAGLMIFLQVVPIAAAFILTVSAGAIFGGVKGTAMVLTCSTVSASISFAFSRSFGRELVLEAAQESPQFKTLDDAFSNASYGTSLLLISLLRLSPVLPFSWANYIFGLSPVPFTAFSLGTFLGCLPAVAAYVNAGKLGAEIVINGAESNDALVFVGLLSTIAAISVAGDIASKALKEQGVDLSAES